MARAVASWEGGPQPLRVLAPPGSGCGRRRRGSTACGASRVPGAAGLVLFRCLPWRCRAYCVRSPLPQLAAAYFPCSFGPTSEASILGEHCPVGSSLLVRPMPSYLNGAESALRPNPMDPPWPYSASQVLSRSKGEQATDDVIQRLRRFMRRWTFGSSAGSSICVPVDPYLARRFCRRAPHALSCFLAIHLCGNPIPPSPTAS